MAPTAGGRTDRNPRGAPDVGIHRVPILRWRRRGDDGATLVEFALILPLLLMLIVGMFTGGMAYNQKQQLTHATREGARFGATVSPSQSFLDGNSWADNVSQLVIDRAAGDLDGPDVEVCVSLVQGSPAQLVSAPHPASDYTTETPAVPCDPTETYPVTEGDNGRRVQVRVSRPAVIELGVLPSVNFTITATATAKSESFQ
jgi:Flp pilus assembly protein TadG